MLLYRGVSKELDGKLNGRLIPKGKEIELSALRDGKVLRDGTFTHGESEDNAVRAHHISTSLYDGCFISTSKSQNEAIKFATSKYKERGYVYVLESNLFESNNVIQKEFLDPYHPDELEVSIRDLNGLEIPAKVIIDKYEVNAGGIKI